MDISNHLNLPYIMPAQAQKHVTHNEAVRALDCLVQLSVLESGRQSPPAQPSEGDRYIVDANATDLWESRENMIACFVDGAWMFFQPREGWRSWSEADEQLLVYKNGEWVSAASGGATQSDALQDVDYIGINGSASLAERFVVQSASSLLNHDGDDHRLKINKANIEDTASLIFQSGFSGRAELGLAGGDALSFKVSPNGNDWQDALVVDAETGEVSLPAVGLELSGDLFSNLLPDSGRFNSPSQQHALTAPASVQPDYLSGFNGSLLSFPFLFIRNNGSFGGTLSELDPNVEELIVKIFGAQGLRYGPEFWCMKIQSGSGTSSPITIDGDTFHRASIVRASPRPARFTTGFFVKALSGKLALRPPLGEIHRLLRDGVRSEYGTSDVVVSPSDGWVYFEIQMTRSSISYERNDMALNLLYSSEALFALPRIAAGWVEFGANQAVVTNDRVFGN